MNLLSGIKSTFNNFIEITKYYWCIGSELLSSDLTRNATDKYSNMVAEK